MEWKNQKTMWGGRRCKNVGGNKAETVGDITLCMECGVVGAGTTGKDIYSI
jgi:hypothetical protein